MPWVTNDDNFSDGFDYCYGGGMDDFGEGMSDALDEFNAWHDAGGAAPP